MILIDIIILLLLISITYQDFKEKQVYWFIFPILTIAFIVKGLFAVDLKNYFQILALNLAFVLMNFALLSFYFFVKEKRIISITKKHIGLGDILFFVAMCFALSTVNFVVFFVLGLFFSLIIAIPLIATRSNKQIPLAGIFSIFSIAWFVISEYVLKLNSFNDFTYFTEILNY